MKRMRKYHRNGINRRIRNARRRTIAHRVGRRKPRRARHTPRDGAQQIQDVDFENPIAEDEGNYHRHQRNRHADAKEHPAALLKRGDEVYARRRADLGEEQL